MAGLLNAFSSGFLEGARGGALIDATWAAQDERERKQKEEAELQKDMKAFAGFDAYMQDEQIRALPSTAQEAAAAAQPFNMKSPEGQQAIGGVLMTNPQIAQAVTSNPGHVFAGVVKNPKKEDEFYLTVRTPDGAIRPVTANREAGGIPVAYTGQQLLNMAASSLDRPGLDTPEFRQQLGLPLEGDIYQAMAAKYPSMGTAEQIQQAAVQGKDFVANGGIPAAKQGTAGVKAAVKSMAAPVEEEEEEEESTEKVALTPEEQVLRDKQLMRTPEGRKELARRSVELMSGGAAKDDGTGLINQMVEARNERAANNEAERQARIAEQKENGTYGARGIGKIGRDIFDATKENVEQNVTQPLGRAASAVVDMARGAFNTGAEIAEGFAGAEPGAYQISEPAAAPKSAAAAADPITAQPDLKGKPRDVAEVAVERQRVPAKVFNNSVHVEKLDKAIESKVAKEPLNERVAKDQEALDRLSKLGAGQRPNSRDMYLAMRLVKSGILTADQLGKFRETGKLDNTEFENAYKEQAVRQSWTQLDLAKQRLSFDQFREQMDQQRHMQNQSIQRMRLGFDAGKENSRRAEKVAEKVYTGVHDILTADFMARMQQSPQFKDTGAGDLKFYAGAAATRLLNDPTFVRSVLKDSETGEGRDIRYVSDAEEIRPAVKYLFEVNKGEWLFGAGENVELPLDFKVPAHKLIKSPGMQPKKEQ